MPTTTGAILNAIGILLGALIGLARETPLSLRAQLFFRNAIGAANFLLGARLIYLSIGGTFGSCLKQLFIAILAVVVGFWVGKLLRFQKMSNYLGRLAGNVIVAAQKNSTPNASDGFNACAILFCAAPLGLIGAVADGLSGYVYLLAVKAVMDALAMTGFIRLFRWPSALSAIPVFVFFSAVTMTVQFYVTPRLSALALNSVNATAGLLACVVTIVIFEIRKVELANYLPALAIAPLLVKLFD
ncbi:MAG TPA: DUF554 family protein [Pseudomonadales bacterium]|nr:DUF554 family protein [Pseudomonadales bacterium]